MKAVRYDAATRFRIADLPIPDPGPGQILIKVIQVGLCGTDLHIHHGEFGAEFPLIPGHEVVGTVAALGDGVTRFRVGEQVTRQPQHCLRNLRLLPVGPDHPLREPQGLGVNCATASSPSTSCVPEPLVFSVDGLPADIAVLHRADRLRHARPGDPGTCGPGPAALVLGAGPTGLLLAQLIASGGAAVGHRRAPEPVQARHRRRPGRDQHRADHPRRPGRPTLPPCARPRLAERGYDIVVEATGSAEVGEHVRPADPQRWHRAGLRRRPGPRTDPFPPYDMFRREITIKGSFAEMTSFGAAIAALRAGRVAHRRHHHAPLPPRRSTQRASTP